MGRKQVSPQQPRVANPGSHPEPRFTLADRAPSEPGPGGRPAAFSRAANQPRRFKFSEKHGGGTFRIQPRLLPGCRREKSIEALKLLVNEEGDEDDAYFEIAEDRLSGKSCRRRCTESEFDAAFNGLPPQPAWVRILKRNCPGRLDRAVGPGTDGEFRPTPHRPQELRGRLPVSARQSNPLLSSSRGSRLIADGVPQGRGRTSSRCCSKRTCRSCRARAGLFKNQTPSCMRQSLPAAAMSSSWTPLKRVNRLRRLIEYRVTVDRSRLDPAVPRASEAPRPARSRQRH